MNVHFIMFIWKLLVYIKNVTSNYNLLNIRCNNEM